MGFWIFMLISGLLTPLLMIGFGNYFVKSAGPTTMDMAFGYRTPRSMRNIETWKFAHRYCGKLWIMIGWVMFAVYVIAMLLVVRKALDTVGILGSFLMGVQVIFLIVPVIFTERALKRKFDENSNPKRNR